MLSSTLGRQSLPSSNHKKAVTAAENVVLKFQLLWRHSDNSVKLSMHATESLGRKKTSDKIAFHHVGQIQKKTKRKQIHELILRKMKNNLLFCFFCLLHI